MPANEYFDSSGVPVTGADVDSSVLRAEFDAIEEGFNKMPVLSGKNSLPVFVNSGGSALESKTLADARTALGVEPDVSGGYVGLTLFKINFKNALNTFTSFFTNANTAARTYTFQDRDGTIADIADVALKAPIASPTFTGVPAGPTAAPGANTTQFATTAFVSEIGALKAPIASPTFTGVPAGPTAAPGTNTTQIATTAFVKALGDLRALLAGSSTQAFSTSSLTASGNVEVISPTSLLGYGAGAGGSVTQLIGKDYGVTINKPCGQIITSGSALAAGVTTYFDVSNSLVNGMCVVVVNLRYTSSNYLVHACQKSTSGMFTIYIKNTTGGTLSDVLTINFAVLNIATS